MNNHYIKTLIILCSISIYINSAQAAIIYVNNDQDIAELDGNCDLRDAINSANINFAIDGCTAGDDNELDYIFVQVTGPIQLESTLPVFSSILISTNINVDPVEIKAPPNKRHMRISPNSVNDNDFTMINFKLTGGIAQDGTSGGAMYFTGASAQLGNIELSGMIFENNHAGQAGGAIVFDDTFADSLRIYNNVFVNNTSVTAGGAISGSRIVQSGDNNLEILRSHFEGNSTEGSAGAIFMLNEEVDTININDSHFINNAASDSVGAIGLGAWVNNQTYHVNRNLFLNNHSSNRAGALEAGNSSIVYVEDSLFAFNSAARGGAVTAITGDSLLRLSASTLVHNSASISGDNIYIYSTGRLIPSRNIIAYPANGDNCSGQLGTTNSGNVSNNITDDDSCELLDNLALTLEADPLLSGFSDNPATYPGFAPTTDSPAIDRTDFCNDEDLMENPRPIDGDGNGTEICDVGAIEAPLATDLIWSDSFGL